MSTVQAFNSMLRDFLQELSEVFPEQRDLATFLDTFGAFVAISPRKPMEMFIEALTPHSDMLMARNPDLFVKFEFPGVDLATMWNSEGVSTATRDAIWQYLQTLFLLGSTVQSLPPELLKSIETVANDCADKMQNGELDFGAMASALLGGLGPLAGLASGGLGPLAQLAAGATGKPSGGGGSRRGRGRK